MVDNAGDYGDLMAEVYKKYGVDELLNSVGIAGQARNDGVNGLLDSPNKKEAARIAPFCLFLLLIIILNR